MHIELKKAIVNFIFEHLNEFQLHSAVSKEFKQYLYTDKGEFCIGGEAVKEFIDGQIKLIKS